MNKPKGWVRLMIYYTTCLYTPNPGPNLTAFLTLGGFLLLAISALAAQFGAGPMEPVVLEIGKASFYTGIGRAFTQAEADEKVAKTKK